MSFKNFFRRKGRQMPEPQPLRIEGVEPAPLTPEPDDAELAAQALLEMMCQPLTNGQSSMVNRQSSMVNEIHDAAYYRRLAERIRQAHDAATLRTMRFVAFCEQELKKPELPKEGPGSLGLLEAELYKRIDVIERVGGDLKKRWQHCLATVTVRLMNTT